MNLAPDPERIDEHYITLLEDPRMHWRPMAAGGYQPVCTHGDGVAYPARRLVDLARSFGYGGAVVGSICAEDLLAPIYQWWERDTFIYSADLEDLEHCVHIPRVARAASGLFPCQLIWELPETRDYALPQTPTACSERPDFLSSPDASSAQVGPNGGALCVVRQVPVLDPEEPPPADAGDGFYVDVSASAAERCFEGRIMSFTRAARPPAGVSQTLRCGRNMYYGSGSEQHPTLGDPCDYLHDRRLGVVQGDERCALLGAAESDTHYHGKGELFCHPDSQVCVMGCQTSADCPTDWLCESTDSPEPFCINPSCG